MNTLYHILSTPSDTYRSVYKGFFWLQNKTKNILLIQPEHLILDIVRLVGLEDGKGRHEHPDGEGQEEEHVDEVHDQPGDEQPTAATNTSNNLRRRMI